MLKLPDYRGAPSRGSCRRSQRSCWRSTATSGLKTNSRSATSLVASTSFVDPIVTLMRACPKFAPQIASMLGRTRVQCYPPTDRTLGATSD